MNDAALIAIAVLELVLLVATYMLVGSYSERRYGRRVNFVPLLAGFGLYFGAGVAVAGWEGTDILLAVLLSIVWFVTIVLLGAMAPRRAWQRPFCNFVDVDAAWSPPRQPPPTGRRYWRTGRQP